MEVRQESDFRRPVMFGRARRFPYLAEDRCGQSGYSVRGDGSERAGACWSRAVVARRLALDVRRDCYGLRGVASQFVALRQIGSPSCDVEREVRG